MPPSWTVPEGKARRQGEAGSEAGAPAGVQEGERRPPAPTRPYAPFKAFEKPFVFRTQEDDAKQ